MNKTKLHLLILFVLSFIFVLGVNYYFLKTIEEINLPWRDFAERESSEKTREEKKDKEYTLLFGGDIMLDRGVKHMVEKYGDGDYTFVFKNIVETLKEADILFGNLESVISDKGYDVGGLYSFRAEPQAIKALTFAEFDMVTLANNHAFDYTRKALEDTMNRLREESISYTGVGFDKKEAHTPAVLPLEDGTRVGFLGYTDFLFPSAIATKERSGITELTMENMKEDIEKAKKEIDILIVTFHYGIEYEEEESARQRELSRGAIDYGADIVIGHHPHVTQGVEKYEGKYIAYSLGNFVFDQYFSKETMSGFLIRTKVKEKEIVSLEKVKYVLNKHYQPEVVEIKEVE